MAIVTARFRVHDKRAAQLGDLLRGLSAQVALEGAPEIETEVIPVEAQAATAPEVVAEPQDSAADVPQEVQGGEQGLLRAEHEDGTGLGQEGGQGSLGLDSGDGAGGAEDGALAEGSGQDAAALQGGGNADDGP